MGGVSEYKKGKVGGLSGFREGKKAGMSGCREEKRRGGNKRKEREGGEAAGPVITFISKITVL